MQDIPADSSITPLNQPVDPDRLLPESIDDTSSSKTVTLSESEMSPQLRLDLAEIQKFYSLPINHNVTEVFCKMPRYGKSWKG